MAAAPSSKLGVAARAVDEGVGSPELGSMWPRHDKHEVGEARAEDRHEEAARRRATRRVDDGVRQ